MKGFTYIELIIYMAIVTVMMATLIPVSWNIIQSGNKSATQQEVFANARFISQRLQYEIRNASGINSVSTNAISLIASGSANPTVIDVASGNIRIKQGVATPINLNSQNASISALTFTNYTSTTSATKHIQFSFTVTASYSGAKRQDFTDATTIEGSAEVRSN